MVEHFADAVAGEIPLAIPPDESVQNMRVLDALAESARSGVAAQMSDSA
jgi:predicted dehydrogenase